MDNKNIENKFKNLSEKDIKAINGFVDFFSGITNSNMEKFKIPVEITLNDENIIKILKDEYLGKEEYRKKYCLAFNEEKLNKALEELLILYENLKKENQNLRIINNTLNETYKSIENRNNLLQQQLSDIDNKLKEFGIE